MLPAATPGPQRAGVWHVITPSPTCFQPWLVSSEVALETEKEYGPSPLLVVWFAGTHWLFSWDGTVPEVLARFAKCRERYRARLRALEPADLDRELSYLGRYQVTGLDLLKTHALHLAGHRFQVRYVRGTYSRAHGTPKADFDPW